MMKSSRSYEQSGYQYDRCSYRAVLQEVQKIIQVACTRIQWGHMLGRPSVVATVGRCVDAQSWGQSRYEIEPSPGSSHAGITSNLVDIR